MAEDVKEKAAPRRREDRRIRRTKRALREALTTLMQEKPVQDIRVRELAEMVDINRGTFYRYYRDIYDMLAKLEDALFAQLEALFDEQPTPLTVEDAEETLVAFFAVLGDNRDLVLALMGKHGDPSFVERIRQMVRERIVSLMFHDGDHQIPDTTFEYVYAFVVSGCTGLIERWLSTGAKESPEQIANIVETIVARGLFSGENLQNNPDGFEQSW